MVAWNVNSVSHSGLIFFFEDGSICVYALVGWKLKEGGGGRVGRLGEVGRVGM